VLCCVTLHKTERPLPSKVNYAQQYQLVMD